MMGEIGIMPGVVLAIAAASSALNCAAQNKTDTPKSPARDCSKTIVLQYEDFGPQVAAYELIGYQWYQWLGCPCGDSDEHEIKVVVYRGIPLKSVKRRYPVVKGKIDYRYLDYKKALSYLDSGISFNHQEKVSSSREGDSAFASMSEGLIQRYQYQGQSREGNLSGKNSAWWPLMLRNRGKPAERHAPEAHLVFKFPGLGEYWVLVCRAIQR